MNPNVTKEGIEVRIGQVWRDLDYRQDSRLVKVRFVKDGVATVSRCNPLGAFITERVTKLSVRRMHKSSTGWELQKEMS